MSDSLVDFAHGLQRRHDGATTPEERKARGHFGTPPAVARLMAETCLDLPRCAIRLLDPGAGVGTLTAAVCDRVASLDTPRRLHVEAWENDPALVPALVATLERCQARLRSLGHDCEFTVRVEDFVLSNRGANLFGGETPDGAARTFDLCVMNPPYFKLRKDSPQARAVPEVVHGQPNVYTLFLAVAAGRLRPGGRLVAITPRSYFNGPYFRRFRHWFFERMSLRRVHVFESRSEAFRDDAVLQENVVVLAERSRSYEPVVVTGSVGRDVAKGRTEVRLPYAEVLDDSAGDAVVRVVTNPDERDLLRTLDALPGRLRALGLEVSTGPVVAFRAARHFLKDREDGGSAPLLWPRNVRPFAVVFPPATPAKPVHLRVCADSRAILLPSKRYVLLKRFTAKEEKRRLVAGLLEPRDSYSEFVGLENHLNYVHRPGGELSRDEALGLAALLNSAAVDRYFRAISGSTQVNAAEIRNLPLPNLETITRLGRRVAGLDRDEVGLDHAVAKSLGLPDGTQTRMASR